MKIKRIFTSLLLTTVVGAGTFAQKATKSLNDGWAFSEDQVHWKTVNLPHTWNTDAYHTSDYKQGVYCYKRKLILPDVEENAKQAKQTNFLNKRYFLKLEAASKTSTIYINGKEVGKHRGGYTASVFDLTPFVFKNTKGTASVIDSRENELLITVDNADKHVAPISADFTFMGGIYRNVKLITTGMQHFSMTEDGADGVFTSVKNVSAAKADVVVKCRLRNDEQKSKACYVVNTLYAPDGSVVSVSKKKVLLPAHQTVFVQMPVVQVKNPVLWSPETPNLYQVKSEILEAESLIGKHDKAYSRVLDSQVHHVGMRWCEFDAQKGFFLNGKPNKLNGMCRHQDQRPYGVALDDDMQRRDVRLMKEMGCNFVRLAHYPQAEAVLEQCDKLGLLVWEEIPVVNYVPDDAAFAENACQQLCEMIRQHINHPSIVLWGYMNEILLKARNEYPSEDAFEQEIERINHLAALLEKIVHEEDPTRHSTMALHGSNDYHKYHVADHSQVLGWNLYQGWYGGDLTGFERYLADQQKKYPDRPVFVSEWGAGSDLRLHSLQGVAFDFSCEYQQKYIEHYLPVISDTPYILGGSYWNFVDFSSASRAESMPHINNKGILTPERQKKDVYYYFQAAWRKDVPVVHIATRDWADRKMVEKQQEVKVYSNAKEVSLMQNGKLLGTKPVQNHFALFVVDWKEGKNTLVAKGIYNDGMTTVTDAAAVDQTLVNYHSVPIQAEEIEDLAVNVGSHCYFVSDKSGMTWVADQVYQPGSWGYLGGKPSSTQAEITSTTDGPLYQTMREGIEGYRFDVPKGGRYELELLFTDTRQQQAQSIYLLGKDQNQGGLQDTENGFDVELNGKLLEKNFNPGIEAGYFTAIRRSYLVESGEEGIVLKFSSKGGKTFLSAIRLRKI